MTEHVDWEALTAWSKRLDYREVSDEANRWAAQEVAAIQRPSSFVSADWSQGAVEAALSIAFEAGREYERRRRPP